MLVAVKFRKKAVENMLPIVLDLIKQSFASLFSELGRSWIRGAIILETNYRTTLPLLAITLMMMMMLLMVVIQVSEDSVAARCGLRAGDIVVRLCGQSADRMTHLMAQQTIASCGDTLEIIVERFTTKSQIPLH